MAQYYYDTYNVDVKEEYVKYLDIQQGLMTHSQTGYSSYTFDSKTGQFSEAGTQKTVFQNNTGETVYVVSLNSLEEYIANGGENGFKWNIYRSRKEQVKSRGSVRQYNLIAEDGTYPNNGIHTDGYWYVKKGIYTPPTNTAPTTPGAFTQPTGSLEIGDSKVFTVGASSDAEANLSKYVWEVSINNGTFTKVGETQSPSFTYTIPTATSLKMRVKAVDSAGLESGYRESSVFTVTKPKYYWSKYNLSSQYVDTAQWTDAGSGSSSWFNYYKGWWFNSQTNLYEGRGGSWFSGEPLNVGSEAFRIADNGKSVYRYVSKASTYVSESVPSDVYQRNSINNSIQYSKGSLVQSGIIAEEGSYPIDGRHSDGFWYVQGSRVNQSIAPPNVFTSPEGSTLKKNTVVTITFGASSAQNVTYEADYRYNQVPWVTLGVNGNLTRQLTITTDTSKKTVEFRVRAKNTSNVYSDYIYSSVFTIEHNVIPTVTLNTQNNMTLYENSTYTIDGSAIDSDDDQSVSAYYQIDNFPRKVLGTGVSKTPIVFNKQLVFKSGKLFDGDTVITDALAEGVAHTLKVWSQDDQGGISKEEIRSFHVVPNRAPVLTINPIDTSSCNIDNDFFNVNGTCKDLDGNEVIVSYRINKGLNTEIYRGKDGNWSFELSLKNLLAGENTIVVEVVDSFGAKTSVEKKLNKTIISTPILSSVARYKIKPSNGTAKGVLVWIQRQEGLSISAEISMVLAGEQENFAPMELTNTAPLSPGVIEDEFYFNTTESKDNIVVKLDLTRASADVSESIELISGVLE